MVIVFDMNGTLLDSQALGPSLRKIFGGKLSAREWFHELLEYSMAGSLAGDYRPFDGMAAGVLQMEAAAHKVKLTSADVESVQMRLKTLPPYREVERALRKLQRAKFRLAVLTNSTARTANEQVSHAGLAGYFEQVLSVDAVRRYKPSPEVYKFAADALGVRAQEMLMVAAHPWDLLGAGRVGYQTAFIRRPGKALFPPALRPNYIAKDLADLAAQLVPVTQRMTSRAIVTSAAAVAGIAVTAEIVRLRRS